LVIRTVRNPAVMVCCGATGMAGRQPADGETE
jgi:hypothetical protein